MVNAIEQFRRALASRGILPPTDIIADGKIHRCDAEGKGGRGDAAYLLHLDAVPAGGFQNHRDGLDWENWRADVGRPLSLDDERTIQARIAARRAESERAKAQEWVETKARASTIWDACARTVDDHPYLTAKAVRPHKARKCTDEMRLAGMECKGALVVPMRNIEGEVCSLQFITATDKRYLNGPKPDGLYFSIGTPSDLVCIAEGFATGASIHESTGLAVAVAFDCGNIESVARSLHAKLPHARIVLCADDDYQTEGNPGVAKATAAARAIGGIVAVPDFGADRPDGATDFNDLAQIRGFEAVKCSIEGALTRTPDLNVVIEHEPMARLICAASIKPEPINWIWNGWLAAGKLHILAGAPGTGKTTVAIALAATISRGGSWPDRTKAQRAEVLIWSAEDDPTDTLVPRLAAMDADMTRVHFVTQAEDEDKLRPFDPATDIAQLRAFIRGSGIRPSLLIVDPIVSAVAGDSHKGSETRRSLQPLVDFGAAHDCAILGISHFSKGTAGRDVVERVTGSIAFGALARLVFAAAKLPDDQGGGRFIARAKSNIGIDGGGFNYELRQCNLLSDPAVSTSTLLWGEPIEGNARDILATAEVSEDSDDKSQASEAVEWLGDLLSGGPVDSKEACKKAKAFGISDKSLRTARARLKVKPQKVGYGAGGRWVWDLPADEDALMGIKGALDAHTQSEGHLGTFDDKGHISPANGVTADDDAEGF